MEKEIEVPFPGEKTCNHRFLLIPYRYDENSGVIEVFQCVKCMRIPEGFEELEKYKHNM
jgi:hypothetical protein